MKKNKNKPVDPQEIANEVYNSIGQAVFKVIDKEGYLNQEDTVYASAYSLISLAADLIKQTTKLDESEIFTNLAEVLADSLEIEFKIEEESEKADILSLPQNSNTKKMLN